MILHFRGLKNLDKSGVLLFPNLQVCLDCGFSRFRTTETELALLAGGTSMSERLTRWRAEDITLSPDWALTRNVPPGPPAVLLALYS
jgi:hypothetical protein